MDYQGDTPEAGGGLWRYPDNVVAGEADADEVNSLPAGMFNYSKYVRYISLLVRIPCILYTAETLRGGPSRNPPRASLMTY
jgi:hypothetical protein